MSPYEDCVRLAWAGALIITVTILLLNIFAHARITAKSPINKGNLRL
jgi:phosphate transport system permease protein